MRLLWPARCLNCLRIVDCYLPVPELLQCYRAYQTFPECMAVLALSPDIYLWALRKALYVCVILVVSEIGNKIQTIFCIGCMNVIIPTEWKTCAIVCRGMRHSC